MTDIARLGIEIDTTQVDRATSDLRSLKTEAEETEKILSKPLGFKRGGGLGPGFGQNRLNLPEIKKATEAAQKAEDSLLAVDSAANKAVSSFTGLGRVAVAALAPFLPVIAGVVAGLAFVTAGFAAMYVEAKRGAGDLTKDMGLTEKQLDRLKKKGTETGLTLQDVFEGVKQTLKDRLGIDALVDKAMAKFAEFGGWFRGLMVDLAGFGGAAVGIIIGAWKNLPAALTGFAIDAANGVINALNKALDVANAVNAVTGKLSRFERVATIKGGGGANALGKIVDSGFEYEAAARSGAEGLLSEINTNAIAAGKRRIRDDAGEPGKASKPKEARAEKDPDDEEKKFLEALKLETEGIGLNTVELKKNEIARNVASAKTGELKEQLIAAGKAWIEATNANASKEFNDELKRLNDQQEFENSLLGKNAKQREIATAARLFDMKVADAARNGLELDIDLLEKEKKRLLELAEIRGQSRFDQDEIEAYTDSLYRMNDAIRNATRDFGDLFGSAGEGFANLLDVMLFYGEQEIELQERLREARQTDNPEDDIRALADIRRAQIDYYGDVLSASKTFFKESSDGYKALESVERAYRAYQLIAHLVERLQILSTLGVKTAAAATGTAVDTAATGVSVANSATRASADGVAAFAKTLASLPFPFNIAAGAAVLALLASFGVKLGGKGGSGAPSATIGNSGNDGTPLTSDAQTSPYSTLPGAGGLYDPRNAAIPANDNRGNKIDARTYNISAPGADAGTVEQIRQMLSEQKASIVEEAREASAADYAAASTRQNLSGGY